MAHVFDSRHAKHLDNPLRNLFQPAKVILKKIGLDSGHVFLDFGAGSGYYSLPASSIVGESGEVIAIDASSEMVAILKKKAEKARARNVTIIQTEFGVPRVDRRGGDVALLSMVLHEIDRKAETLEAVRAALKEGGRIAVIEFAPGGSPFGPPAEERIGASALASLLGEAGFVRIETSAVSASLYLITAVKKTQ